MRYSSIATKSNKLDGQLENKANSYEAERNYKSRYFHRWKQQ